ncbi:MAG: prolyl oligopeptidase family serine peptidase [Acidobacteria bacterium]|nr:prolyl oligopeptidase family serine peptidase [Acidobacteriota bacterium]
MSDVVDTYRWLEDPDSPETIAWVTEQNRRSEAFLSSIPQRDEIRARLTALWNYERRSPPSRHGEWYLFSANSGLQPQAVLYKTRGLDEAAEVLLDPNTWSDDGTIALAATSVSEDGRLLAYAKSSSGSDWMTWHVRDIATSRDLPDEVCWSKFSGAAWAHDGGGFYYAGYAPPAGGNVFTTVNTNHVIFFHTLGDTPPDRVVFSRPDHPDWLFSADVTDDGRFLVITQSQGTHRENRIFVQDLTVPDAPVLPFLDRFDASYRVVDNDADVFHVWTDHGAPRGRLVSISRGRPEPAAWTTVIAEPAGTDVLSSVARVGAAWVAAWRTDAHERLCVHDRDGRLRREVPLPALGAIPVLTSRRVEPDVFFAFASFTYPGTIFRHTVETGVTTLWHQPVVDFEPGDFETRQVFYTSKDGTRVPMFIVHKRGLVLDGRHRAYLYGYGGFDISLTPAFSASIVAWMERGGIFAQANLRGGGEYGKAWHDAGRLRHKQNVFDDFIAAAEYLIREGYTTSSRLAIGGGSNGGLLVGACLTQRPDLFGAAVPAVGVLDMLRFHKFTIGWAWTSDYGNPDDPDDRAVLLQYSPLHNIRPGVAYPATLVITADHDDRVAPAHSHKFTATLQDAQAGAAPILSRIDVKAGHGAGKPTAKVIDEKADVWAFLEAVLD